MKERQKILGFDLIQKFSVLVKKLKQIVAGSKAEKFLEQDRRCNKNITKSGGKSWAHFYLGR